MHFGDVDNANGGLRDPKHMGRAESPCPSEGKASSFISGRAREKAHGKHSWICVETSLLARAENTIIFFKFPQYKEYYGTSRLGQLSCDVGLTISSTFLCLLRTGVCIVV